MRAPFLFWLSLLAPALAMAGCGETFEATGGGDAAGGRGGDTNTETNTGTSQGGGDTTTSQGGGGAAPLCEVETQDECALCLVDHCEADVCACLGSPDCLQLAGCLEDAGPDVSFPEYELCWQYYKNGISLAGNLQACGFQKCGNCGYPEVTDCQACQYRKCPAQINSCFSNSKCTALLACVLACEGDGECVGVCATDHPEGVQLLQQIQDCASLPCGDVCN